MNAPLKFLTSLRLAIVLLILIISASILGTLIPQGRTAAEYAARYGGLGPLLQGLGLTALYRSVWYVALLLFFGVNLLICTLTRLGPKIRRAFSAGLEMEEQKILTLFIKDKFKIGCPLHKAREAAGKELRTRHYRLREKVDGNGVSLSGRKKTAGFFGSDLVHFGILIILAGGVTSGLAGFKSDLALFENQTRPVPRAEFSLRLDKFETEYYPDGSVRDWKSALTVMPGNKSPLSRTIEVNHPLSYGGFHFYQSAYGWDWDSARVEIQARKKSDPSYLKKLEIKTGEKADLGDGLQILAARFIPDFIIDEKNNPSTRSLEPNNPAVLVEGWEGAAKVFSGWIFSRYPDFTNIHGDKEAEFSFELNRFTGSPYSVIQVARDPGVGFIWLGSIILMAGLFISFYWSPQEIRMRLDDFQGKTEIAAGGILFKNRETLQAEFSMIMDSLRGLK